MALLLISPSPARRPHRGLFGYALPGAAFLLTALGFFFFFAPGAQAQSQGEAARRLGAQLLVLGGDLRRLENADIPTIQKVGLRRRITGMLGDLAWQLRLNNDTEDAPQARLYAQDWQSPAARKSLAQWLDMLARRHPLDIAPFDPKYARPQDRAKALALHAAYCAACHGATPKDAPPEDAMTARPARSLYAMARNQSLREFIARMVSGVRGDRMTGLSNPLSDAQIAALIALYQKPKQQP